MTTTYELKNIKIAEWASEETTCFTATLYANGKRIGTCSNDGHGACHRYDFNTDIITTNAAEWLWQAHKDFCDEYGFDQKPRDEFHATPDTLIDSLIDQHYLIKDANSFRRSVCKKNNTTPDRFTIYSNGKQMTAIPNNTDHAEQYANDPEWHTLHTTPTITA